MASFKNESPKKDFSFEKVTTYAKQATTELDELLYQDTGFYKPWQFAKGTTHPVLMDSVIEDLTTYWNEPTRLRPGFKTIEQTVYTPTFFTKISGVYHDINTYYTLVQNLKSAENCLFYESPHFAIDSLEQSRPIRYHNVSMPSPTQAHLNFKSSDLDSLAQCLDAHDKIDRALIQKHILYHKMARLRLEVQEFILTKLEDLFSISSPGFFLFPIDKLEKVKLMATLFTAEDRLLGLIESYDFTATVPKILFYLNSQESFSTLDALLVGLFHLIGLDIILLSPNGAPNLELVISKKFINEIVLETFAYDLPLKLPIKKKSFLSKLFK